MSNTSESVNGLNNGAAAQGVAASVGSVGNGTVQGLAGSMGFGGNGAVQGVAGPMGPVSNGSVQGVADPIGAVGNGAVQGVAGPLGFGDNGVAQCVAQGVAAPVYPVGNGLAPNWGYQGGVSNNSNSHEAVDAAGNKLMRIPIGNNGQRVACPVPTIPELKAILKATLSCPSNYFTVSAALGFVYERNKDLLPLLFNWLENQLVAELVFSPQQLYALESKYFKCVLAFANKERGCKRHLGHVLELARDMGFNVPTKFSPWLELMHAVTPQPEPALGQPLGVIDKSPIPPSVSSDTKEQKAQQNAQPKDAQADKDANTSMAKVTKELKDQIDSWGTSLLSFLLFSLNDDQVRLELLANNSGRFRYFDPVLQPVITSLYDYCKECQADSKANRPFTVSEFLLWCKEHDLVISDVTMDHLTACKQQIVTMNMAQQCMDKLYQHGWRLANIVEAQKYLDSLCTDSDYERLCSERANFINATITQAPEVGLGNASIDEKTKDMHDILVDAERRQGILLPTGYDFLDEAIGGYRRGQITIMAANSGVGKTWFGLDTAFRFLEKHHGRVVFFSSEVSDVEIAGRLFGLVNDCSVSLNDLCAYHKNGELPAMEARFHEFNQRHVRYEGGDESQVIVKEDLRIYGSDVGIKLSSINDILVQESNREPVDLVVIDYFQDIDNDLFDYSTNKGSVARHEKLKDMVGRCKVMAKDNNCVVLLIAQLNNPKSKDTNGERIPTLNDIAECSYAVHAAENVLMMYKVKDRVVSPVDAGDDDDDDSDADYGYGSNRSRNGHNEPVGHGMLLHPYPSLLRLLITKARFSSAKTPIDKPIRVERTPGSRFDFYL